MPKMAYRLHMSDRFTPGEQRVIEVLLTFMNEIRAELGLERLTEAHVIEHIRRYERLAQTEKEGS